MHSRTLSSLNLLRVFEAAARQESFKAAGAELCITASAVSQQVKALESELGVPLFERHPRGLSLTEAGRRYADALRPHLAALSEITRALREARPQALRVTMMPPLASRVVFPRIAQFRASHPAIELLIDTGLREADLQQRQFDLAVRSGNPPWPGCVHRKVCDLHVQAVAPPAVAQALDLRQHPQNIARAPLVHMTGRPDSWPRYFATLGLPAPSGESWYVDDYPAAIEAAETLGLALAVLPMEKPLIASGRVVAVGPALGPLPESVWAVMLAEKQNLPAIGSFLDWLAAEIASIDRDAT